MKNIKNEKKNYKITAKLLVFVFATFFLSFYIFVHDHSGGSMELNACILLLVHMVYL